MGERGAPPDPLNGGLYCRHCSSKYCSCDGNGNPDSYWVDYYANEDSAGDNYVDDPWTDNRATDDPVDPVQATDDAGTTPEAPESEGWTVGDSVTVGAIVVVTGAAIAFAGPLIGISAGVAGFVGGSLLSRIFGD